MHKDESSSKSTSENNDSEQTLDLSLGIKSVAFIAFVFGIVVGGAAISVFTGPAVMDEDPVQNQQEEQLNLANADLEDLPDDIPLERSAVDTSRISTDDSPVLGDPDAPVTLVMYEDYQCPACQQFETQTFPDIKNEYVDSGEVKVVWKDYPIPELGHDWTETAHSVNRCVYEQDRDAFWEVKDRIFENSRSINSGNVEETVIGFAEDEGVAESDIRTCLENDNPMTHIENDKEEAESFEAVVGGSSFVSGTPSFVIYSEGANTGTALVGAMPFEIFQLAIEESL